MRKLEIPCAYQGGKARLAKEIVEIILREHPILLDVNSDVCFYDLCCGSGAVSIEMINQGVLPSKIKMIDASPWGRFWQKVGEGTFDIVRFNQQLECIPIELHKIKSYVQSLSSKPVIEEDEVDDTVYKFLILQSCAFGATATWVECNRWKKAGGLRDYWVPTETSKRRSPVNPMMPMPQTLSKRVETLNERCKGLEGKCEHIENVTVNPNSIVYLDPPYDATCKYGYSLDYESYIKGLPGCVVVYLSEGKQLTPNAVCLSLGRTKGGIAGNKRKKANEEWLNVYKKVGIQDLK